MDTSSSNNLYLLCDLAEQPSQPDYALSLSPSSATTHRSGPPTLRGPGGINLVSDSDEEKEVRGLESGNPGRCDVTPPPRLQLPNFCCLVDSITASPPRAAPIARAVESVQDGYQGVQGAVHASSLDSHICQWPGCHKQFSSRWHLLSHSNTHSARRQFQCQLCPLNFARKHDLTRHTKSVHAVQAGVPVFTCSICGKGYGRMDSLRRHVENCSPYSRK
ncbi:hypothetical protein BCR33DRAFT_719733 [Rhizoclosmatium globosum]|uniref:C2H2-type domain-containing protein n=1 Tax=Rhizoclosmatium globosum TaxID=329046 RepID=A0A1Y2BYR4_9FUNG|nr:hypothetical protein BCR33DRAFT_719733 [Rhizoclosmatium globosum]|eukprot:ORY39912.1 hypothetical protein BCR33DRAFT_719733 [Rhizoclosmatium globosum]